MLFGPLLRFLFDEIIDEECRKQFSEGLDAIKIEIGLRGSFLGTITLELVKSDFEQVFDDNNWNPWPEVKPPIESGESHWLVQDKDGRMRSMRFIQEYGPEVCYAKWSTPKEEFDVIAFRKLPERYQPEPMKEADDVED